jgi:hypothetical protein
MPHQLPMGVVKLNICVNQYGQANQVGHFDGSCFLVVMVDYICMYNVYKSLYRKPIFNSLAIIIQPIDYLTW